MFKRHKILITGQVQGVGFRPAVHRIAVELGLTGFVYNDTNGVTIELQGPQETLAKFPTMLNSPGWKPPMAQIKSCKVSEIPLIHDEKEFIIRTSDSQGPPISHVTADIATCPDCLREMQDKNDFRFGYPFINCTNCGPRYSIIKNIPYDRPNTTMSPFRMCDRCAGQYSDVTDRRFHAQPVACSACGPKLWLADSKGTVTESRTEKAITEAARLLLAGKIVAIKGLGGFHLAADALNNHAVSRLRQRKRRDHKPFAMMADSLDKIKQYAIVDDTAEQLLKSPQSPIVLLPKKPDCPIAESVCEGVNTFGFMLCYTPLHYLLFKHDIDVLVMTSGNISDEPLICKNDTAIEHLGDVADAFLMHDREIYRQVDDSIVHFVQQNPVLLRRARGYVPVPIINKVNCQPDILAAGADLKNTFCLSKQNMLICSEHIGDLADAKVYHHYIESIEHLSGLFEVKPEVVVCDLHPGYLSTQYARSIEGGDILQVQHHWAHVASVLAEHNLDEPVIGLVCDGTGYGSDGAIWGCECLVVSLENFERFGHLEYYPLPGGDKASKQAVRPAMSLLKKAFCNDFSLQSFDWLLGKIEPDRNILEVISEQLDKNLNCVQTSSLGRAFDAVSSMLGMGSYNHFDAQLPMALEAISAQEVNDTYDYELIQKTDNCIMNLDKIFINIVSDIKAHLDAGVISAKFHNTIAEALLKLAEQARQYSGLNDIALSGGVFCNRYLIERLIKLLQESGFIVLYNRIVPSNDGGISLGQAAIAARKFAFL